MAGVQSNQLTNRELVYISRDIVTQEYYRLGHALGYDYDSLKRTFEELGEGCTLKILLDWRDDQSVESNQREILAERLTYAGLHDKRQRLLPDGSVVQEKTNLPERPSSQQPIPAPRVNIGVGSFRPDRALSGSDVDAKGNGGRHLKKGYPPISPKPLFLLGKSETNISGANFQKTDVGSGPEVEKADQPEHMNSVKADAGATDTSVKATDFVNAAYEDKGDDSILEEHSEQSRADISETGSIIKPTNERLNSEDVTVQCTDQTPVDRNGPTENSEHDETASNTTVQKPKRTFGHGVDGMDVPLAESAVDLKSDVEETIVNETGQDYDCPPQTGKACTSKASKQRTVSAILPGARRNSHGYMYENVPDRIEGVGEHAPRLPPRPSSMHLHPTPATDTGFPLNNGAQCGIANEVLNALALDVDSDQQIEMLAKELGFRAEDTHRFVQANREKKGSGTRRMLFLWRDNKAPSDQTPMLKYALRKAGLLTLANKRLKVKDKRRDLSSVKIAKNFTIGDMRKRFESNYMKHNVAVLDDLPSVFTMHQVVEEGSKFQVKKTTFTGGVTDIISLDNDGVIPRKMAILAPPGGGKTTFVSKMAYDWVKQVQDSPLRDLPLLVILSMRDVTGHMTLGQAIISQHLHNVKGITPSSVEQVLDEHQNQCLVVLEGLDEFRGDLSAKRLGPFHRILRDVEYKQFRVIVTSRPHCEHFFDEPELRHVYTKIEMEWYTKDQSRTFIRRFMKEQNHATDLIGYLENHDVIDQLMRTPLYCTLACDLWKSDLLQRVITRTEFFENILRFFAIRSGEDGEGMNQSQLDNLILSLGEVALHGLIGDNRKRYFSQQDFRKTSGAYEKGLQLRILSLPRQMSDSQEDDVEFFDDLAQAYCAGKYLAADPNGKVSKSRQTKHERTIRVAVEDMKVLGNVLCFATSSNTVISKDILQMIIECSGVDEAERCRLFFDCLAEQTALSIQTASLAERFVKAGVLHFTFPSVTTAVGLGSLPTPSKEKIRSVRILTADMPKVVATRLSNSLGACRNLIKLEVEDIQHQAHPVVLMMMHKLSVHLSPGAASLLLAHLHQNVVSAIRLVNIAGCQLCPTASAALWHALRRCPIIDELSVRNSSFAPGDLPELSNIRTVKVALTAQSANNHHGWLASLLSETSSVEKMDVILGNVHESLIPYQATYGLQEHMFIGNGRMKLFRVSPATLRVLEALPSCFRNKMTSLTVLHSNLSLELSRPILAVVESFPRLEKFDTKECKLSDEVESLKMFKASSSVMRAHPAQDDHPSRSMKGSISSPLRDDELEWILDHLHDPQGPDEIDVKVTGSNNDTRQQPSTLQMVEERLLVIADTMEIFAMSAVTMKMLLLLPAVFSKRIKSVAIRHTTLTAEVCQKLWQILENFKRLESFSTDDCVLCHKLPHLSNVCQLKLDRVPKHCVDWTWLADACYLEDLEVFISSPRQREFSSIEDEVRERQRRNSAGAQAAEVSTFEGDPEYFRFRLSQGNIVVTNMSSDSLLVLLNLGENLKREVHHVRIRSHHMTLDLMQKVSQVLQSYKCLPLMTMKNLRTGPTYSEINVNSSDQ